jgi:hypothetical protein
MQIEVKLTASNTDWLEAQLTYRRATILETGLDDYCYLLRKHDTLKSAYSHSSNRAKQMRAERQQLEYNELKAKAEGTKAENPFGLSICDLETLAQKYQAEMDLIALIASRYFGSIVLDRDFSA